MPGWKLGQIESQFADIIWDNEPIQSGDLVQLSQEKLSWKKPTTYTVLRKLCQRGLFQNQAGIVTSVISRRDFRALRGQQLLDEYFEGSLVRLIRAITHRRQLSSQEITEIKRLLDKASDNTKKR
ncbi:MAG TPA: BlaI/MecI/CopY family transcriptional regulator [Tissierellia bacterium]|nr:BlaI/MecI/CopY family transcriptional regulator [Tissierellia bacterium]